MIAIKQNPPATWTRGVFPFETDMRSSGAKTALRKNFLSPHGGAMKPIPPEKEIGPDGLGPDQRMPSGFNKAGNKITRPLDFLSSKAGRVNVRGDIRTGKNSHRRTPSECDAIMRRFFDRGRLTARLRNFLRPLIAADPNCVFDLEDCFGWALDYELRGLAGADRRRA